MHKYSQRNMRNALLSIKFHCVPISFGDIAPQTMPVLRRTEQCFMFM